MLLMGPIGPFADCIKNRHLAAIYGRNEGLFDPRLEEKGAIWKG
jgi:hypothetical protein